MLREALSYYPLGKRRRLFERIGNQVNSGTDFRLSLRDPVRKKISPNASVLSVLAKFNHEFSVAAFNTLGGIQTNVSWLDKIDVTPESMTKYYDSNTSVFSRLNDEIRKIDLGIKDVILEQTPQGIEPSFHHIGHNQRLGLIFESHGTRRFYAIFPFINYALESGGVAVLDELDSDIHSLLLPELVQWFQNPNTNPKNAQLIISCHNATLLEHLVKEEVYFTEKDRVGCTHIYGLKDVKGVRRDTNIYAKYLAGVFGAVPHMA